MRRLGSLSLLVALTLPALSATAPNQLPESKLKTDFAFTAMVAVGEPLVVDKAPGGIRRFIPITGGTVSGPLLNGKVLAAGGDSQLLRPDGVLEIEARYLIKSDDGVVISVVNRGLRVASPAVMARLMKGEHVGPDEYYFRTVAQFEAPVDSVYRELNRHLYVATAEREPNAAVVHFFVLQ
jgi:hypothetical protein